MDFQPGGGRRNLSKPDKLTLKADFDYVRQNGRKFAAAALVAVVAPGEKLRCGVICGKKYSLLAVKRNRARRLLWESFRLLKPAISPCTLILIPRREMALRNRMQVTRELAEMLVKAGKLPRESAASAPGS
ncbi:MAG: ribonuclease P protein component [Victivallaceae bacterium]|nr:ribonuclease P protein component [Victivallaceae bacterium]